MKGLLPNSGGNGMNINLIDWPRRRGGRAIGEWNETNRGRVSTQ